MIVLSDTAFHATARDPSNLTRCQRGAWQDRLLVETVLSMLTVVCHFKKVLHREWAYCHARLAFTMAAFTKCIVCTAIAMMHLLSLPPSTAS